MEDIHIKIILIFAIVSLGTILSVLTLSCIVYIVRLIYYHTHKKDFFNQKPHFELITPFD
jgi:hypothetical protein